MRAARMDFPHIIIAEDEPELRGLLLEAFEDAGLSAIGAADGVEALALLKANPTVSLLLSDIRMPNMDGYRLAEEALAHNDNLKLLMMTGYPTQQMPPSVLRAREVRTLVKPFNLAKMCDLVVDMLAHP